MTPDNSTALAGNEPAVSTQHQPSYILETERLRLREFTLADASFIIELVNSAGWLQFIGDRNVKDEEQALAYLENGPLKTYRQYGYGLSLVETKTGGQPIGMCGIINRDNLNTPDIGFALLPEACGKGYGEEIAAATLQYAKEKIGLKKIVAVTMPSNAKSIRLLEKIGLRFERQFNFPGSPEQLLLYSSR